MKALIEVDHLSVGYRGRPALEQVTLDIGEGFTAFIGPSGAGKSTLLRSLNGLVPASGGAVRFEGARLGRPGSVTLRGQQRRMGMVFQGFNLVRRLSALDNVLLGRLSVTGSWRSSLGLVRRADRALALHLLERVGLADQAWQRADQLSGGQQQRVGIARALAQEPRVILADEPISALDPRSAEDVMRILHDIQARDRTPVIANLHFLDTVRQYASRVVALRAGRMVFDGTPAHLTEDVVRALYQRDVVPTHPTGAAPARLASA